MLRRSLGLPGLELLQRAGGRLDWYDHTLWARTRPAFREALPMVYHGLGLRTPTRGTAQNDDLLLYAPRLARAHGEPPPLLLQQSGPIAVRHLVVDLALIP